MPESSGKEPVKNAPVLVTLAPVNDTITTFIKVQGRDLTELQMYVPTDSILPTGSRVKIEYRIATFGQKQNVKIIDAIAEVTAAAVDPAQGRRGVLVKFLKLSPNSLTLIQKILEKKRDASKAAPQKTAAPAPEPTTAPAAAAAQKKIEELVSATAPAGTSLTAETAPEPPGAETTIYPAQKIAELARATSARTPESATPAHHAPPSPPPPDSSVVPAATPGAVTVAVDAAKPEPLSPAGVTAEVPDKVFVDLGAVELKEEPPRTQGGAKVEINMDLLAAAQQAAAEPSKPAPAQAPVPQAEPEPRRDPFVAEKKIDALHAKSAQEDEMASVLTYLPPGKPMIDKDTEERRLVDLVRSQPPAPAVRKVKGHALRNVFLVLLGLVVLAGGGVAFLYFSPVHRDFAVRKALLYVPSLKFYLPAAIRPVETAVPVPPPAATPQPVKAAPEPPKQPVQEPSKPPEPKPAEPTLEPIKAGEKAAPAPEIPVEPIKTEEKEAKEKPGTAESAKKEEAKKPGPPAPPKKEEPKPEAKPEAKPEPKKEEAKTPEPPPPAKKEEPPPPKKEEPPPPPPKKEEPKPEPKPEPKEEEAAGGGEPGSVLITSSPLGEVFIDGKSHGNPPVELKDVKPRRYKIEVKKEGYKTKTMNVTVKPGDNPPVFIKLEAE